MERITFKDLDNLRCKIEKATGRLYSFEQAYGGIKLTTQGQNENVSINGFESKRSLYNFMQGFYRGVKANG